MDQAACDDKSSEDRNCSICLEKYKSHKFFQSCGHVFCKLCLEKVLKDGRSCALCREDAGSDVRPATYRAIRHPLVHDRNSSRLVQRLNLRLQSDSSQGTVAQDHSVVGCDDGSQPTPIPPNPSNPVPSGPAAGETSPQVQASLQNQAPEPVADDNENLWSMLQLIDLLSGSPRISSEMVFSCPYCQEGGLDELDLLDHCNINHRHETRPVVCPICVALPHGEPSYYSRDFIGHLNLRHSFYTADYTNVDQTDTVNQQAGLLESYKQLAESQH